MKSPLSLLLSLAGLLVATAPAAHAAAGCDLLRSEVEGKIASAGVTRFSVTVVDADAPVTHGKVVGSCELGSKKLVYETTPAAPGTPAVAAPAAKGAGSERILTECRDGTVSMGGACKP
ncbi:MAG: DUF1161 domain-containing protein [Rhodocyclaceae bacterium]|nr:DUF1161 domain-containing protein [Pseudomonadota bacterium]MDQ7973560.1 DUF1161 domain-containing protein [Rhodocyclaceae bacterium]MDQ8001853.1 DUF1161 domain-containing protein [Pseudomonadota bacterium]MDQ8017620.1 DUF1161 domain-containing protein [Pseudomonadota bacterium]